MPCTSWQDQNLSLWRYAPCLELWQLGQRRESAHRYRSHQELETGIHYGLIGIEQRRHLELSKGGYAF